MTFVFGCAFTTTGCLTDNVLCSSSSYLIASYLFKYAILTLLVLLLLGLSTILIVLE